MNFIKKQEVAERLQKIIDEKFNKILRKYARAAEMTPSTLQSYVEGGSLPGGENLVRLAKAGHVTTDWILMGEGSGLAQDEIAESRPEYEIKTPYTQEEQAVIKEYCAASDAGKETGRVVFRMNPREQKKVNHLLRRKTDPGEKISVQLD